jgi:hypothetical protein
MIGATSVSGLRLLANLGVTATRRGIVLGDQPQFLLFPRVDSLTQGQPLGGARMANTAPIPLGQSFRFNLYVLGHTDPEGLDCRITPVIE